MNFIPKILITGKYGQVGWELQRALLPLGKVIATDRHMLDLANNDSISQAIQQINPDIIVNAAAYTAVDTAENDADVAMRINGMAPGILAEEAKKRGALLVHYSTDYVFDGTKSSAYFEKDNTDPINMYGKTKLAGEQNIHGAACDHLILRTSWVYGSRGHNFFLTMLRLMKERDKLRIIDDQTGTPTWARLIADATAHIIRKSIENRNNKTFSSGIYHLTSEGQTTWYGFANQIAQIAQQQSNGEDLKIKNIDPINTEEYPTPAKRPKNSLMSNVKLEHDFNLLMPSWKLALELCMKEMS